MGVHVLKIPAEVVNALRLPPDEIDEELLKELSLALYGRGLLSSGSACRLSGMTRLEFENLLGKRGISRHYTKSDLEEDLEYARGHK